MTNTLLIENISKKFGANIALNNISLKMTASNIYGVIGPNGSGKTTLLNCISGIYNPDSGNIYFNDFNISKLSIFKISRLGIRRTFQTIRLFKDMTLAENIYSGAYLESAQNIFHSLTHLFAYNKDEKNIWAKVKYWADYFNLSVLLNKKAGELDYGSQRKAEIARAMIANPLVLLLDEPAAGMNENEKLQLTHIIKSLKNENLIIVLIEHDMSMISSLCNEIIVLHHGQLIDIGSFDSVKNNPEVISAYIGQDFLENQFA